MIYTFDRYELDTDVFELRCAGVPIPVEPQVLDVLVYLARHGDRVVPKEELLDQVWGDRFVSESALTSRVKSARRAVGDSGSAQRIIRTVHGRGYRFVAEVRSEQVADRLQAGRDALAAAPDRPASAHDLRAPAPMDPLSRTTPGAPRRPPWPLLGRSEELAWILGCLEDTSCGGVVLTGPAGVGKSRLAEEVAGRLEAGGIRVANVVGHPEARSLPLAALAHLLPADIAEAGSGGALDQATIFHRARAALRSSGGGGGGGDQRVLLRVEDVEQLDQLSLAVVISLVMARDVFALLTMRTPADTPAALRSLLGSGQLRQAALEPLDPVTSEELLHRVLGAAVQQTTVRLLVETAEGNAGVLRQLVASSIEAGSLAFDGKMWSLTGPMVITADLRDLVRVRLTGLSEQSRLALGALTVAGKVELGVLAGIAEEEVIEDLDARGLLDVTTSGRRTHVAVAHPLFAEVLHAELSEIRGRRLRRDLAEALEQTGARRREDRVRLAAWRVQSGGPVDGAALVDSVRLALAGGDQRLAGELLDRLDAVADPATVAQLRAEWHFRRGENPQVEEVLASLAAGELPPDVWAQVVRRRAGNRFYGMGDFDGAVALLDQEIASCTGEPRLMLEALRATLLALDGNVDRALELTADGLGRAGGASRLELLRARSYALALHGEGEAALAVAEEGFRLSEALEPDVNNPGAAVLRFVRTAAYTEMGLLTEARRSLHEARNDWTSVDGGWTNVAAARLALLAGDTPRVREGLDAALARFRAIGHKATERWLLSLAALSRVYEGDLANASADMRRVADLEDDRGLRHNEIDRTKAWLAAHLHDVAAACSILEESAVDAARYGKLAFQATLVHDLVRLGEGAVAVDRLVSLSSRVDGPLIGARAAHAVAVAGGDAVGLAHAAARFEALGCTLFAAEAWAQAAEAFGAGNQATERERALEKAGSLGSRHGTILRTPALLVAREL